MPRPERAVYAAKRAHPLIQEAADLYEADRLGFERRVEKGRPWFFGPPHDPDSQEVALKMGRNSGQV